jgi:hypothetical protein
VALKSTDIASVNPLSYHMAKSRCSEHSDKADEELSFSLCTSPRFELNYARAMLQLSVQKHVQFTSHFKITVFLWSGRHYHLVTSAHRDSFSVNNFTN